jgi:hypothetical protein
MATIFKWQPPVALARNKKLVDLTVETLGRIENIPGVYYFARSFGGRHYPFYIGKTMKLRDRLKAHLKSKNIADILRGIAVDGAPQISNGPRDFYYAYFLPQRGQKPDIAITTIEKLMIRIAVENNIPLLNTNLTLAETKTVEFLGITSGSNLFNGTIEFVL